MLRSFDDIQGYRLDATDGEIGHVEDVYFDDQAWSVRYVVVRTGSWLFGRHVLIAPAVLGAADWKDGALPTSLSKAQIEAAPPVESNLPVSRQQEADLISHFNWPCYWGAYAPLAAASGDEVNVASATDDLVPTPRNEDGSIPDPDLRSGREVCGYHVHASDGELGHIDDLIIDDEAWQIRYAVLELRNLLPGRKVLFAPQWLSQIEWGLRRVTTDRTQQQIQDSPPYDPDQPINRDTEGRLYDYHGRPGYWL